MAEVEFHNGVSGLNSWLSYAAGKLAFERGKMRALAGKWNRLVRELGRAGRGSNPT